MLAISTAKFTGRVLKSALTKWLAYVKDKRRQKRDVVPHGKQTVQQLARQNQGMTSIEIKDEGIREFERIARKYGVDFAVKRAKSDETKYLVFFKARDADALTALGVMLAIDCVDADTNSAVGNTIAEGVNKK